MTPSTDPGACGPQCESTDPLPCRGCRQPLSRTPAERRARPRDVAQPRVPAGSNWISSALRAASAAGNPEIRPAHLLMALLTQTDGIAAPLLEAVGVDPATIGSAARQLVDEAPRGPGAFSTPQLTQESLSAITAAQQLAAEMDDEYVSTEHLLVGLATGDSDVAKLLTGHGASPEALRDAFVKVRGSGSRHQSLTPSPPTRRWRSTPPT